MASLPTAAAGSSRSVTASCIGCFQICHLDAVHVCQLCRHLCPSHLRHHLRQLAVAVEASPPRQSKRLCLCICHLRHLCPSHLRHHIRQLMVAVEASPPQQSKRHCLCICHLRHLCRHLSSFITTINTAPLQSAAASAACSSIKPMLAVSATSVTPVECTSGKWRWSCIGCLQLCHFDAVCVCQLCRHLFCECTSVITSGN